MSGYIGLIYEGRPIKGKRMRTIPGKNGMYKDQCHYSKTGWAWHNATGCTCRPCKKPLDTPEDERHNREN